MKNALLAKIHPKIAEKMKRKRNRAFLGVGIGAVVLLLAVFLFRKSFIPLLANGADNVLRPLIGEENTLKLESVFFGIEDKVNALDAKTPTSADALFNTEAPGTIGVKKVALNSKIDLSPIAPITQLAPLAGEGVWEPIPVISYPNEVVAARTVLHVDDQRSFAYTALVKLSSSKLNIGAVAGIKQPGGPIGNAGPGKIPDSAKANQKLIAAFDGGFQYRDGAYGMIADGVTYVPLRNQLATILINNHGMANIVEYNGEKIANDIVVVRQNGPLLVKNGEVTSFTEGGRDTWGRTITTSMYTWRSGIGVTKDGDLVFAVGPSLVPRTLALALKAAGAVNAMQLDINPFWVRFVFFSPTADGSYTSESLLKNMENGGATFLSGYEKDFFFIYSK